MSPRSFRSLLWLPLAVAFFAVRPGEAPGYSHNQKVVPGDRSALGGIAINNPLSHSLAPHDILQFASGRHVLGFAADALYVASGSHALRVQFVNARPTTPVGVAVSAGAQGTPQLSRVTYPNLWDGITLTYDAPSGAVVRSTYRIEPQADAGNIRLRYNARVAVQEDGSLRVSFATGTVNESAPQAWQERGGKQVPVRIAFAPRAGAELTFAVGEYDRSEPLFIDPTLTWNTFLGSADQDESFGVAVDAGGNVYVAGYSTATWGSPISAHHGSFDAFLAKLDSNGNLTWNTFIGGSGNEAPTGLALDVAGNAYVTGYCTATWGSPVSAFSGGIYDAFVAKLDSNGALIWNTFVGGGPDDRGNAIAVDLSGNVYLAGLSRSSWGTPVRAFSGGPYDAFAAKLDSSGAFVWNTFLGGGGTDHGYAVAVDVTGNVYVVGFSTASWESPVRAFSGVDAAFAAKLDSGGSLIWNTFLGGGNASGTGVAVDVTGNVYVSGSSQATWGSPVRPFAGNQDAYAAKLDSSGALTWNTFLGSSSDSDGADAVTVDASGNVYVTGFSAATWGSPDHAFTGTYNAFAVQLDSNGSLNWNTFLGNGTTEGFAVAVDGSGNVYLAGHSSFTWGFPARDYSGGGLFDGFVAKLGPAPMPTPTPTPTSSPTPTPVPSPTPTPTPISTPTPAATPSPTPTPTPTPIPTPSFQGSFVIGDGNAVVGNHVIFWGAEWADNNSLSGGHAPASFKGFASATSPNPASCGGAWTSNPGNSSAPPSSIPSLIPVIVTSSITKSGPTISGNIPQIAIVLTDPGYEPNPGHTGTGTVVAVVCP
jgi:hypothetical protein